MKTLTLAVLGALMALGTGCAANTAPAQSARMVASASRLVVEVEGKGTVDLDAVGGECGSRCRIDWDKIADPVLVAEAAPGWRFDHWDAPGEQRSELSDPRAPRTYRAVFRKLGADTAKR